MDADALIGAFQAVVLERMPDGAFVCRSSLPAWWAPLDRAAPRPGDRLDVEEAFPFLSVFLPEAEEAWRRGRWLTSSLWTEKGADGEDVHLEAAATHVGQTPILAIMRNERLFRQQQLLLQRARELRMTHRALVEEMEAKDVLIHAIVHDLGAPLHSILGALALLEEQRLDATSASWVELALAAALRQRAMIREILDVFAAERDIGERTARSGRGPDVGDAVAEVVRELAPVAEQKSVRVEVVSRGGPTEVVGDAPRLVRVIANLLENALRYSPRGGVIRVVIEPEDGAVRVAVEDQGPGVAPEVRPRLFEKLGRRGARAEGSGLGLYFCRITVERWGGRVGFEPRGEGGARFWFRVPAAAGATTVQAEEHDHAEG